MRYTQYSKYCMLELIPRLHQFFNSSESSEEYPGHGGHLYYFFLKLGLCHPDNFKAAYPIYSIFNILHASINS